MGYKGELDQELKKQTAQQMIVLIRSKLDIMPPERTLDIAKRYTPEIPTTYPIERQRQNESLTRSTRTPTISLILAHLKQLVP
ncbi:MAG: hypothetical protein EZS28_033081 [Streblomastix strix]|uniref:Uncharacterized protein n=1 Tax=Streblomastix strix TaxID=222440 RepID=A0A5J4UM83_9EUKA|nr:MAG: hypothetical protein EZS28_033081 [Streblomastix strix]